MRDVANVYDSVQTLRSAGFVNQKPAIILLIFRLPGANVIATVDRIKAALPSVRASIPAGDNLDVLVDLTTTIRASVNDVERTLVISVILVIAVVFAFLRSPRGTLIPGVAVGVSLIGTFGVMYLVGYSLDNLSLMALTISTGFVVDDAIVVMENITRLIELGVPPMEASLQGAQEVGFTVLSMSLSLIAVFVPILFMGGIVGRIFHEFAFVLTTSIAVSMLVSLTVTPMMCSRLLKPPAAEKHNRIYRAFEHGFDLLLAGYRRTLTLALEHPVLIIVTLFATLALNVVLIGRVPKGFFPLQDTGGLQGGLQGAQDASFQSMRDSVLDVEKVIQADPAVRQRHRLSPEARAARAGAPATPASPLSTSSRSSSAASAPRTWSIACVPSWKSSPALRPSCRRRRIFPSAAARATPPTSTSSPPTRSKTLASGVRASTTRCSRCRSSRT